MARANLASYSWGATVLTADSAGGGPPGSRGLGFFFFFKLIEIEARPEHQRKKTDAGYNPVRHNRSHGSRRPPKQTFCRRHPAQRA